MEEPQLEVGDIRCTCSVGRQRVPQWNATNREAALSQICRNDGGKHLVTVPSGSAMGRTLEQVTGRYARMTIEDFPVLDKISPQQPALC